MKTLYETTVINTGGRQGIVQSPDNVFMLDVAAPPELGGQVTTATNRSSCLQQGIVLVLTPHWSFN